MGCPNVAVVLRIDGDSNRNLRHGPCTIDGVKPQFSKTALISSRDAFTISPNRYNVQSYAYIPTQMGAGISCRNCHRQAPRLLPSTMTILNLLRGPTFRQTFRIRGPLGTVLQIWRSILPCGEQGGAASETTSHNFRRGDERRETLRALEDSHR